ncbi:hypothetical protein WA158_000977 [Blastocystis sp. Blastoise]
MSFIVRGMISKSSFINSSAKTILKLNATRSFTTYMPTINFGKHYDAEIMPEKEAKPKAAMLLLHGIGDCGYYMLPYASWIASEYRNTYFYAPTGKTIPISSRAKAEHIAWYDIPTTDIKGANDCPGIGDSYNMIYNWVEEQIKKGIDPKHIVISGYSQGAALALFSTLSLPYTIGKAIIFSGYLPMYDSIVASPEAKQSPIIMYHGSLDNKVPLEAAKQSAEIVKKLGCPIEFKSYVGIKHIIHRTMVEDAIQQLKDVLY